jgi:hypothetical protein
LQELILALELPYLGMALERAGNADLGAGKRRRRRRRAAQNRNRPS